MSQNIFPIDLAQLSTEQESQEAVLTLQEIAMVENVLNKDLVKDFLDKTLKNLESEKTSSTSKYFTLKMFRYFADKNKCTMKIFSLLSGHPLFAFLCQTATNIDPRKSVNQKGKKLFEDDKDLGVSFMRLLLQLIKSWSERFPQNIKKEPTKFKKEYLKLVEKKVVFPSDYIQIPDPKEQQQQKPSQMEKKPPSKVQAPKESKHTEKETPGGPQPGKSYWNQLYFTFNKIDLLIGMIQDEDQHSKDQLRREVTKTHEYLAKQGQKMEEAAGGVFEQGDEKIVELYLKLNQFINEERQLYQKQLIKKDSIKSYSGTLLLIFDRLFGDFEDQQRSENKLSPMQQKKLSKTQVEKSKISEKEKEKQVIKTKQKPLRQVKSATGSIVSPNNVVSSIKDKALDSFFQNQQSKIKRKEAGFSLLQKSLEKEKRQVRGAIRGKGDRSLSKSKFVASTVSRIGRGQIFNNIPNPRLGSKNYTGQLISSNNQLQRILYELKKDQGMRRFKISNLKHRAPLFQNEHLQIGYTTEPLYEKIDKYDHMVQIELFFGNKSAQDIRNLEVKFQGDQRSLVYCSPEKAPSTLEAGEQLKFEVVVIPVRQVYGLVNMRLEYQISGIDVHTCCILPCSVLNFATYFKTDQIEIQQEESSYTQQYRSELFKLSHYLPPRKISHYIEELVEMTEYSQFVEKGSTVDFQLGGLFILKNQFKGMVKIIIRPNLTGLVQVKTNQKSALGQSWICFYLQTLQMILKESR